jgi:hypothetical protein
MGLYGPKKIGVNGPKTLSIHQNCMFSVVIIGLYDPNQGPNLGYWPKNGVIVRLYGPKTGSKLGLLAPKRCQSCQIHQNCVF